ncbi:DUF5107 domain-containing protein [Mucilaginibacter flavus]|uniref:DUF5107 domain-containing protein n=1 Tax=Mucilaginibacter flavus TaxID=931504 RepID=UPI0025B393AB|nr:DUF5107 domain-containing protein [Mucilaginibacter flavus]MDN3583150.1 DUF5107 domain-containing protein [Mucilaginibacter flavus]
MKKQWLIALCICMGAGSAFAQQEASIKEYNKTIVSYPFSDPNPIPNFTNVYPYFRYDGFTDKPVQKEWKIVELENQYIRFTIMPQIGGKIWSAIEKSTGKPIVYENHVIKFRDIAMRGPWTSGGIEPNYGIIGHTPNSVTPVDYLTRKNADGSVSCIISVLDLLTSTTWTMEVNLPVDKAYFTTKSFWYNSTPIEEPYYHWMNTGIKTKGNLQYIFPGTSYLGHQGEYSDWPVNKQNGKDISFYDNNNFGGYKSYHVFGKYTDFFGAYWHDDDFGMARYGGHEDKAGKKIWIWGLSDQGMIWEKLLTDNDGQYSEIQSGRLFNQTSPQSTLTPFKHKSFAPGASDTWTEYWYPVMKTKGFVQANNYGALNVKATDGWLKLYFSPVQKTDDVLEVKQGDHVIYSKKLSLNPLQIFADSIKADAKDVIVTLGVNKLIYNSKPYADNLSRPLDLPKDFDWNSAYGLYTQGKELMDQKMYPEAETKLKDALNKDPYYLPALVQSAMLMYRNMRYPEALSYAKTALSINTNDGAANYYYGVINAQLGNATDAKDGFDIASLSVEYRNAAYSALGSLYLKQKDYNKALEFASRALDFNRFDIGALQVQAIAYRMLKDDKSAGEILNAIVNFEPLSHFAAFERYLLNPTDANKIAFSSMIRNEQPIESYLELADSYYKNGCVAESEEVLRLSPGNVLVDYKLAFLRHLQGKPYQDLLNQANTLTPAFVFPFRNNDEEVLQWAMKQSNSWKPKYLLALLYRDRNRVEESKKLFTQCGNEPDFAPFYAARAAMQMATTDLADLTMAVKLDNGWRYNKLLGEYYLTHQQYKEALTTVEPFYKAHRDNYIIGILYAKTLLLNKHYNNCGKLLAGINILPFEGATIGRELYRETELMQAVQKLKAKNYAAALSFIAEAKKWPANLGAGKPYAENVDERLEDWMSYQCYLKQGNTSEANRYLQKIIAFKPKIENTVSNFLPANDLVTAWAIEKLQNRAAAANWLNDELKQYPNDKVLQWVKAVFESGKYQQTELSDAVIRILKEVM